MCNEAGIGLKTFSFLLSIVLSLRKFLSEDDKVLFYGTEFIKNISF